MKVLKVAKAMVVTAAVMMSCATLVAQPNHLPSAKGEVVHHAYYSLSYIEEHEQAEWVAYSLTPSNCVSSVARSDNFRVDPKVSTTSASPADYVGSGYDRGHLCPAASMSFDRTAMAESFYMSNMSPQAPSFNRGGWKRLEETVRGWAAADSVIYVVTGPILDDFKGCLSRGGVTVPSSYYKVVYSPRKGEMIGFVMPNDKLDSDIASYVVTVDQVESETGIDLFEGSGLDDEESKVNIAAWSFTSSAPSRASSSVKDDGSQPAQCRGVTSKGLRCKNRTSNSNGYCHLHQPK